MESGLSFTKVNQRRSAQCPVVEPAPPEKPRPHGNPPPAHAMFARALAALAAAATVANAALIELNPGASP